MRRSVGFAIAASFLCGASTSAGAAEVRLECNGYNVAINDHVEHVGRITGNTAIFDDQRYRV